MHLPAIPGMPSSDLAPTDGTPLRSINGTQKTKQTLKQQGDQASPRDGFDAALALSLAGAIAPPCAGSASLIAPETPWSRNHDESGLVEKGGRPEDRGAKTGRKGVKRDAPKADQDSFALIGAIDGLGMHRLGALSPSLAVPGNRTDHGRSANPSTVAAESSTSLTGGTPQSPVLGASASRFAASLARDTEGGSSQRDETGAGRLGRQATAESFEEVRSTAFARYVTEQSHKQGLVESSPPPAESADIGVRPPVVTVPAPVIDRAVHGTINPTSAHLQVEGPSGPVGLHLSIKDGVADLRIDGLSSTTLIDRQPELRQALADQGISLGSVQAGPASAAVEAASRAVSAHTEETARATTTAQRFVAETAAPAPTAFAARAPQSAPDQQARDQRQQGNQSQQQRSSDQQERREERERPAAATFSLNGTASASKQRRGAGAGSTLSTDGDS